MIWCVNTVVISLFYCNSLFGCQMYYLINTFELVLRVENLLWHLVSGSVPALRIILRGMGKQEEKEALFSPDNIYFNILCMDSIWTQPLTFSLSLSLSPALALPSTPLGTWWPVNFASPQRLCCRPRTPTSQEERTQDGKLPLIACHALRGVLYCEKLTLASGPNFNMSAFEFWVINYKNDII